MPVITNTTGLPEADHMRALLDVCNEIGRVDGCNYHFQRGLAERVAEFNKPLDNLTIAELCTAIREHREYFNELWQ